ncbi:MAG: cytochrome c oxidase assembly protein [Sporichthyaceae bacterium]
MLAVTALLAVLYMCGLVRLRASGKRWPVNRTIAFGSGLVALVLVTHGFIGVYADTLFYARATLIPAVFIVVPLFLALGRPLTLAAATLPERHARAARAALRSKAGRALGYPSVGSTLMLGLPWVIFFSPWFEAMMRVEAVDVATLVLLLGLGFLYYWTRLQVDPVPRRYPQILSMFIGLGEVIANAALGLALITGGGLIAADYYADLARDWGPSLALDQKIGGGWYWLVGHIAGIPFVMIAFWLARRDDVVIASRVDAELDRRYAGETLLRPWWESDGR